MDLVVQFAIMDTSMPAMNKFLYLDSCIEKGSNADDAIAPIERSDKNFDLAMETLTRITKNSASNLQLRKQFDNLSLVVQQLKMAGQDIENDSVRILIQQKFSPRIIEKLLDKEEDSEDWSTDRMLRALDHILRKQEEVKCIIFGDEHAKKQHSDQKSLKITSNNDIKNDIVNSNSSNTYALFNKTPFSILHNNNGHWTSDCRDYTKSEETIRKQLKSIRRCVNCISRNHASCDEKPFCRKCKKNVHHTIFHDFLIKENLKSKAQPSAKVTAVQEVHTGTFSVLKMTEVKGPNKKMLYLVEAEVFNPKKPHIKATVKIVLDSGAEQSFCTANLEKSLKLDGPTAIFVLDLHNLYENAIYTAATDENIQNDFTNKLCQFGFVTADLNKLVYISDEGSNIRLISA
uniref:Peptidase aspartic putative domain-containing protein n=1 Tax=Acrobeloides nanus TaxID=290746 RepID=A0A914D0D9_9BILA